MGSHIVFGAMHSTRNSETRMMALLVSRNSGHPTGGGDFNCFITFYQASVAE